MRATRVEQVFVRPRAGRFEVLIVLESPAGERRRDTLLLPTARAEEAGRLVAREHARRGVGAARRPRLRREVGGELRDEPELLELFLSELRGASRPAHAEEEPWG